MKVTEIEKVHSHDEVLREERESMYIKNFNTKYKGINRICYLQPKNFFLSLSFLIPPLIHSFHQQILMSSHLIQYLNHVYSLVFSHLSDDEQLLLFENINKTWFYEL